MPLLVRGGGGGKSTKDATAVPGDVRSGKTFYGANGKQTGIWTPKVTDYTGDATALPEDVRKGKAFYNNGGRQVGTHTDFLEVKEMALKRIDGIKRGNVHYYQVLRNLVTVSHDWVTCSLETYSSSMDFNYYYKIENVNGIFAIKVNGIYMEAPSAMCLNTYNYAIDFNNGRSLFAYDYDSKSILGLWEDTTYIKEIIVYYY